MFEGRRDVVKVTLSDKKIAERCGDVSFKKGDAFYKTGKVDLHTVTATRAEAVVAGKENFYVTIDQTEGDKLSTSCTCPSLASFQKDCQHVAAVLLAVRERNRQELATGFINLFDNKPVRSSGEQRHFENREPLQVHFTLAPITLHNNDKLFGVSLQLDNEDVTDIRAFLKEVKQGGTYSLNSVLTYHPEQHFFPHEQDAVIRQLIQSVQDEKVYLEDDTDKVDRTTLLLPASSWKKLLPLLVGLSSVTINAGEQSYTGIRLARGPLPLQFDFSEREGSEDYLLAIKGFEALTLLHAYESIFVAGNMMELGKKDYTYIVEMKRLLENAGTNNIPIPQNQAAFFTEKVAPSLNRIGTVNMAGTVTDHLPKTPLVAKLYLDRVKNRLLASLEFQYENSIINPLEQEEAPHGIVIRDMEKEEEILALMEEGQFAKTDGGYFLHNEELEYTFLHHLLPKLQKYVSVYATTAVRTRVMKSPVAPRIRVRPHPERTNWLEFKFEMKGFPERDIKEVLAALEEKRKYYRLRDGALLSLETREFEEIKRFLHAVPEQHDGLEKGLEVPLLQGLQLLDAADEPLFKKEDSFKRFLQRLAKPEASTFPVPETLNPVLREYQKDGYRWMKTLASYQFGGVLADEMGLGKTLQGIAFLLSELKQIREKQLPALIVCPSSLTYNWHYELRKFAPEIVASIIDGSKAARKETLRKAMEGDVVITSYPLLRQDVSLYEKQSFHTVLFDEAQAFKNPTTQIFRTVKKIQADYRFALTGTPMENHLEELWSIFHVVFPELFRGLKEYSNLTQKQVARRIRPFMLRRVKGDVLAELPQKTEERSSVDLFEEQKKLYAAYLAKLRHDTLKHLDKDTLRKNRIRILAGLTRLRQICCHPALFVVGYKGKSAKLEQLKRLMEESRLAGRRVLIFSQFTQMLGIIGKELSQEGIPYFYLDGQTASEERMDRVNRFNEGERDMFLISLKAGGTGLNLTGADTVILYDSWWNPAVEQQAADRAHRIGQKNEVQVIKLVARGTIEEKMNELQERKKQLIEAVIDPKEKRETTLTDDDIREILQV
ncbi:SNF2 helicase associated domain-containing protein [Oceanobacillus kapialis]|uniref:SNF2 helicase associated domain-containing protein n=1 Tax=Oceanobacillus kapialis TaxID=481353 RepID=UPI00384C691C